MIFHTTQSDLMHLNGKPCIVIRELNSSECDEEVGTMYLVSIEGETIHAYSDELSV